MISQAEELTHRIDGKSHHCVLIILAMHNSLWPSILTRVFQCGLRHGAAPHVTVLLWHKNAPAIKVNCPDCSAVISLDVSDTGHLRYVCQIGHAYSVEELSIAKKALGSMSTDALRARLKESEHQREALRQLLEQSTGLSLALVTYILATQCRIL
jgi:hypothetical protein